MNLSIFLQTIHKSADDLAVLDPYGTGLTIISVTIVFVVLTALYLVFRSIGKVWVTLIYWGLSKKFMQSE